MPTFDHDLLERFATHGDEGAFREFVVRNAGMVQAAAMRQVRDASMAEEVVQEVFTLSARKARSLSRHQAVAAWLHRVTRLKSLHALRAERRRRTRENSAYHMKTHSDVEEPHWHALSPLLDEALDSLRRSDRDILLLRYFKGYSNREVGAELSIREDAAKMRISRALDKLRSQLAKRGIRSTTAALSLVLATRAGAEPVAVAYASTLAGNAFTAVATSSTLAQTVCLAIHAKALLVGLAMGVAAGGAWSARPSSSVELGTNPVPNRESGALVSLPFEPVSAAGARVRKDSVTYVLARLKHLLVAPDTELNRLRMREYLARLDRSDFAKITDVIEEELDDEARRRVLPQLAVIWGTVDPAAAMARLVTCRIAAEGFSGVSMMEALFSTWHTDDPEAARSWLVEHQDDSVFKDVIPAHITTVARGLVETSEQSVVDWAAQLGGADYRTAALRALWERSTTKEHAVNCSADLRRLYGLLAGGTEAEFSEQAVTELAKAWVRVRGEEWDRFAATLSPGRLSWAAALATLSEGKVMRMQDDGERRISTPETRASLTRRGPAALRLAEGIPQSEAVGQIVRHTAQPKPELREWALPLLTGPERGSVILDASRRVLYHTAGYFTDNSPARMALDWAAEHPDPAIRDPLIYGIYRRWLQHKPEEASTFPGRTEWPEDLRSVLQKAEDAP